jgi:Ca2+-binding RTX toxin-like protein
MLTGTTAPDTLTGTSGGDLITGLRGADRLAGGAGNDTFRYLSLADSRLSSPDRIVDFAIGGDRLDAPRAVSAAGLRELGSVAALSQIEIEKILGASNSDLGVAVFGGYSAAVFALSGGPQVRTFVAINDATPGFDANADALIEITGFKGSLANLAIV